MRASQKKIRQNVRLRRCTALCAPLLAGSFSLIATQGAAQACTFSPAVPPYLNTVTCTGAITGANLSVSADDTLAIFPDGPNSISLGTLPVALDGDRVGLTIGNGAFVELLSTGSVVATVDLTGGDDNVVTVENGGSILNQVSNQGAEAVYFNGSSTGGQVIVEQGGLIQSVRGEAIRFGAFATDGTITNSGLIQSTGTNSDDLITIHAGTVINEATGVMRANNSESVVELENTSSLTNHGTIENLGTGVAVEGDLTASAASPESETIVNSGTISTAGTVAISLGNGNDTLELHPSFSIIGDVDAGEDTDTLRLAGSGSGAFDLSGIGSGAQYQNFETFAQTGGDWTYSGTTAEDFLVTGGSVRGNAGFGNLTLRGATIAPGNSAGIGTINVQGDFVLDQSSTYRVGLNAVGQSSLIDVAGTATLGSASKLHIVGALESYPATSPTYTILKAGGGVTGTFETVTDNLPDIDFTATYRNNDVQLRYASVTEPTSPLSAKDIHSAGIAGTHFAGLYFGQLMSHDHGVRFRDGTQRLSFKNRADGTATGAGQLSPSHTALWAKGMGQQITVDAGNGALGWSASMGGLAIGLDAAPEWSPNIITTAALGYSTTQTQVGASVTNAITTHAGLGASLQSGAWQFDGELTFARQSYDTSRKIAVGAGTATARGETSGTSFGVRLGSFYNLAARNGAAASGLSYGPVAGLEWSRSRQSGYTETGAGLLNLNVTGTTTTQALARLGMAGRINREVNGASLSLDGLIALERNLADRWVTTTATLPATGQSFTTRSAEVDQNRAVLGLGASVALGRGTNAYVSYEGRFDTRSTDHRAAIGIAIRF